MNSIHRLPIRLVTALLIAAFALPRLSQATDIVVRIENMSNWHTLSTSMGDKAVGLSPGTWCIHTGENPMFKVGQTAPVSLQRLAEDGNPEGLYSDTQFNPQVKAAGGFNYLSQPYPVAAFSVPGQTFEFVLKDVMPGDKLSLATMFIESNDWFFANNADGIALFGPGGQPISGDVTRMFGLFDAGTEENEEPGTGMNQPPRQSRPDTGKKTHEAVYAVMMPADGLGMGMAMPSMRRMQWKIPSVESMIKVTISPR